METAVSSDHQQSVYQYTKLSVDELKEFKDYESVGFQVAEYIEEYKESVLNYEEYREQYQIALYFDELESLEHKIEVVEFIDRLNLNHKVGGIWIQIDEQNVLTTEMIELIQNRYQNLYALMICDKSDRVRMDLHQKLQRLIDSQDLLEFQLYFEGGLSSTDDSLQLTKQYNQKVKRQKYLEYLGYWFNMEVKDRYTSQEIKELID